MPTILPALRGRSLGRRLFGVFAVTLFIALAGSGYGAWSLARVAQRTQQLVEESVVTERLVSDWYRNVAVAIRRTTAIAVSADPALAEFFAAEAAASSKSSGALQEKVGKLMQSAEEKRVYDEIGV